MTQIIRTNVGNFPYSELVQPATQRAAPVADKEEKHYVYLLKAVHERIQENTPQAEDLDVVLDAVDDNLDTEQEAEKQTLVLYERNKREPRGPAQPSFTLRSLLTRNEWYLKDRYPPVLTSPVPANYRMPELLSRKRRTPLLTTKPRPRLPRNPVYTDYEQDPVYLAKVRREFQRLMHRDQLLHVLSERKKVQQKQEQLRKDRIAMRSMVNEANYYMEKAATMLKRHLRNPGATDTLQRLEAGLAKIRVVRAEGGEFKPWSLLRGLQTGNKLGSGRAAKSAYNLNGAKHAHMGRAVTNSARAAIMPRSSRALPNTTKARSRAIEQQLEAKPAKPLAAQRSSAPTTPAIDADSPPDSYYSLDDTSSNYDSVSETFMPPSAMKRPGIKPREFSYPAKLGKQKSCMHRKNEETRNDAELQDNEDSSSETDLRKPQSKTVTWLL